MDQIASRAKPNRRPVQSLSRLLSAKEGVAAVEFAMILPILLILLVGMAETVTGLNYDRKVSQAASSVADLVAQTETVNAAEVADIMNATTAIMDPYPAAGLSMIVASVTFDGDGNPEVDWSSDKSGGEPWSEGSSPPIDIPAGLRTPNTSLVIGKADYTYIPTFGSMLQNIFPRATSIALSETYFLRPRLSSKVEML